MAVDLSKYFPGGGNIGQMVGQAMTMIQYGIYAAIAILICVLFWKFFLQFNIAVRIRILSGSKIVEIKDDKAKKFKDKHGKWKLELFKMRKTLPVPNQKFKYKKGKKDYYELWAYEDDELHPTQQEVTFKNPKIQKLYNIIQSKFPKKDNPYAKFVIKPCEINTVKIDHPKLELKPIPQDVRAFHFDEDGIIIDKFREKDKLLQWATVAMPVVVVAFVFLILFFFFQHMGTAMEAIAKSIAQLASSCKITP